LIQPPPCKTFADSKKQAEAAHTDFMKRSITQARACRRETVAVVRTFLAHHQGMSLVAIANLLNDGAMRSRFHAEPMVQATELLLQERTPRDVLVARPRAEEVSVTARVRELTPPSMRRFTSPHSSIPRTHLLSNGDTL